MPTYDWAAAAATSICMAARITGRSIALVPSSTSPERLSVIQGYCRPWVAVETVPFEDEHRPARRECPAFRALARDVPASTSRTPGFLGTIETRAAEIAALAHEEGALAIVGVDPISLGVLEAPPRYGADIVCGELQPLGIPMHFGGGLAGFVASP